MSQVEKLEALLAKVQANRQSPRVSRASVAAVAPSAAVPAPLASQSPISVAPPPETAVASEPPITSIAPQSVPAASAGSEPSIEVGTPSDAQVLSPEPVSMPQVLAGSGSPWVVVGSPAAQPKSATFMELLERSLSLTPR